jgi:hypothetical protein
MTGDTDNIKTVSKTPLAYFVQLFLVVCTALYYVLSTLLHTDFSKSLYENDRVYIQRNVQSLNIRQLFINQLPLL